MEGCKYDSNQYHVSRANMTAINSESRLAYWREYGKKYRQDHKEERQAYFHEYARRNKDKIANYRATHKDTINERKRQYYQDNKDEILQKTKRYREENKHKRNEHKVCGICGGKYQHNSKSHHEKTKKHQRACLQNQQDDTSSMAKHITTTIERHASIPTSPT